MSTDKSKGIAFGVHSWNHMHKHLHPMNQYYTQDAANKIIQRIHCKQEYNTSNDSLQEIALAMGDVVMPKRHFCDQQFGEYDVLLFESQGAEQNGRHPTPPKVISITTTTTTTSSAKQTPAQQQQQPAESSNGFHGTPHIEFESVANATGARSSKLSVSKSRCPCCNGEHHIEDNINTHLMEISKLYNLHEPEQWKRFLMLSPYKKTETLLQSSLNEDHPNGAGMDAAANEHMNIDFDIDHLATHMHEDLYDDDDEDDGEEEEDEDDDMKHKQQQTQLAMFKGFECDKPMQLRIVSARDDSIALEWNCFSFEGLQYNVDMKVANTSQKWHLIYEGYGTQYAVPNLVPNTEYLFRARYDGLFGQSPWTKAKAARTTNHAPLANVEHGEEEADEDRNTATQNADDMDDDDDDDDVDEDNDDDDDDEEDHDDGDNDDDDDDDDDADVEDANGGRADDESEVAKHPPILSNVEIVTKQRELKKQLKKNRKESRKQKEEQERKKREEALENKRMKQAALKRKKMRAKQKAAKKRKEEQQKESKESEQTEDERARLYEEALRLRQIEIEQQREMSKQQAQQEQQRQQRKDHKTTQQPKPSAKPANKSSKELKPKHTNKNKDKHAADKEKEKEKETTKSQDQDKTKNKKQNQNKTKHENTRRNASPKSNATETKSSKSLSLEFGDTNSVASSSKKRKRKRKKKKNATDELAPPHALHVQSSTGSHSHSRSQSQQSLPLSTNIVQPPQQQQQTPAHHNHHHHHHMLQHATVIPPPSQAAHPHPHLHPHVHGHPHYHPPHIYTEQMAQQPPFTAMNERSHAAHEPVLMTAAPFAMYDQQSQFVPLEVGPTYYYPQPPQPQSFYRHEPSSMYPHPSGEPVAYPYQGNYATAAAPDESDMNSLFAAGKPPIGEYEYADAQPAETDSLSQIDEVMQEIGAEIDREPPAAPLQEQSNDDDAMNSLEPYDEHISGHIESFLQGQNDRNKSMLNWVQQQIGRCNSVLTAANNPVSPATADVFPSANESAADHVDRLRRDDTADKKMSDSADDLIYYLPTGMIDFANEHQHDQRDDSEQELHAGNSPEMQHNVSERLQSLWQNVDNYEVDGSNNNDNDKHSDHSSDESDENEDSEDCDDDDDDERKDGKEIQRGPRFSRHINSQPPKFLNQ